MTAETKSPDAILSQTNLSGAVGDIQDDPDSPDGLWLTASGNNVDTDVNVSFPSPTGDPKAGADLQEFRAYVRQFDTGQSGNPDARIELWENGSLVRAGGETSITGSGQVIAFTWNATELGTADGSLVECKVVGTRSGGSPGARNTVEVGAIEWNVDYVINSVLAVDSGGYTLTGTAINQKVILPPESGSYALSGQVVNLLHNRKLVVDPGGYNLTGQTVTFTLNIPITLESGAYDLTGVAAALLYDSVTSLIAGGYTLTGQAVSFLHDSIVAILSGTYNLTGQDAGLLSDGALEVSAGVYNLTGQTVALLAQFKNLLTSGSYISTGLSVIFLVDELQSVTSGVYIVTGQTVNLTANDLLAVIDSGGYDLEGELATLRTVYFGPSTWFKETALAGSWAQEGVSAGSWAEEGVAAVGIWDKEEAATNLITIED